jgi:hypothetical protein
MFDNIARAVADTVAGASTFVRLCRRLGRGQRLVAEAATGASTFVRNAADAAEGAASEASAIAKTAGDAAGRAAAEVSTFVSGGVDAVGEAASRAASAVVRSAADAAEGAASEALAIAKTLGGAAGRAAAEVSTFVSGGAGAVEEAALRAASAVGLFPRSEESPASEAFVPVGRARGGSASGKMIALFATCVLGVGAVLLIWISHAYRSADIIGMFEALIVTIVYFSFAFWLTREYCAWRRLALVEELQRDLSDECRNVSDEKRFRAALRKLRKAVREPGLIGFVEGANLDAETVKLRQELDQIGLRGLDANAIEVIRQGTRDVFFLSFISMSALIETAVFSLRALGMIRRIASVYGYRPSRIGSLRLVRHILADIALLPIGMMVAIEATRGAGSAFHQALHHLSQGATNLGKTAMAIPEPHHMVGGAAVTALGMAGEAAATTAESVTPRVADAALAAGRMGHLGLLTIAHVRPVSLSRSNYGKMRNAVYKQILGLRRDAARRKK